MYVVFLQNQGRNQTVRRDEANIRRAEGENLYGIGEGGSRMLFLSYLYGYFLKVVAFFITYRSTLFVLGCYTAQLVSGVVEEYSVMALHHSFSILANFSSPSFEQFGLLCTSN